MGQAAALRDPGRRLPSLNLLIVILPALRPLRLLRLVTLLRILHRTGGNALRGRIITYVLAAATLLIYAGALAVLDVEENAEGSNITNFGDALWWAMTTITTVGYGDHFPVTPMGRMVAGGLMIGGIAVLGVVTAAVASWLVENVALETAADVEASEEPLRTELARLARQIDLLTAQLAGRQRSTEDFPQAGPCPHGCRRPDGDGRTGPPVLGVRPVVSSSPDPRGAPRQRWGGPGACTGGRYPRRSPESGCCLGSTDRPRALAWNSGLTASWGIVASSAGL